MTTKGRELRVYPVNFEIRAASDDDPTQIVGYAAVFDSWSEDLGGFREKIRPGAFTKTLQEADIRALWNHDPNFVLGRNRAGTLSLEEDEHGLLVTITPPEAQWARDLMVSVGRGDVDQMSIAFRVIRDEWKEPPAEAPRTALWERTLIELGLYDVSAVTFPAYTETEAHLRSLGIDVYNAAPPQEGHPADDKDEIEPVQAGHSVAMLRRRLRLIEAEE